MNREFSGWGVIVSGGLLAMVGCYWLYAGWDHIQIERGWSQFIAGAMALSSGVVTMAIGRLIRLLVTQPRALAVTQAIGREAASSPSARAAAVAPESQRIARPPEQTRYASPPAGREALSFDPPAPQANASVRPINTEAPGWSQASMSPVTEAAPGSDEDYWRSQEAHYHGGEEPTEVDRYMAGDSTYVMFSDGSVEVRSPAGVRLYASLDALRANLAER
jgi:hypothetical protein